MATDMHQAEGDKQGRILVVDDDSEVRKVVCRHLAKAGYDVVEAEDGEKGIQAMKSGDNVLMVDTIICDIHMPKIKGTEAIPHFRAQYPSVPIVVLTGFPETDLAVSLMKQGVKDYLVKPVAKEKLLAVIKKSVNEHVLTIAHAT